MTAAKSAFDQLVSKLQTIAHLKHAESLLNYDRLVFMPKAPEAAMARGVELSALASVIHEKSTDRDLFKLLEQAEQDLPTDKVDAPFHQ